MAIKRIVGLEGDTVVTRAPFPFSQTKVPFGHVWLEGEHPEYERNTLDSNTYGPVRLLLAEAASSYDGRKANEHRSRKA